MTGGRIARSQDKSTWLATAPILALYGVQFMVPLAFVIYTSFRSGDGSTDSGFTLAQFKEILTNDYYHQMLTRSVVLGLATALLAAVLGYPLAYAMTQCGRRARATIMALVLLPLLTSTVVRSFGWMVLLGGDGWFAKLAGPLANPRTGLMYSFAGVLIAMAHVLLPFMVMTLYGVLDKIDPTLRQASLNLGASRVQTFFKITFSLSLGGVVAGMLLVFSAAVSTFVTPQLIGGAQYRVIPTEVYDQAVNLQNWSIASALALLLMVAALLSMGLYTRLVRGIPGGAAV